MKLAYTMVLSVAPCQYHVLTFIITSKLHHVKAMFFVDHVFECDSKVIPCS